MQTEREEQYAPGAKKCLAFLNHRATARECAKAHSLF